MMSAEANKVMESIRNRNAVQSDTKQMISAESDREKFLLINNGIKIH